MKKNTDIRCWILKKEASGIHRYEKSNGMSGKRKNFIQILFGVLGQV